MVANAVAAPLVGIAAALAWHGARPADIVDGRAPGIGADRARSTYLLRGARQPGRGSGPWSPRTRQPGRRVPGNVADTCRRAGEGVAAEQPRMGRPAVRGTARRGEEETAGAKEARVGSLAPTTAPGGTGHPARPLQQGHRPSPSGGAVGAARAVHGGLWSVGTDSRRLARLG